MPNPSQETYSAIFDVRGRQYDEAMRRWPRARDREFGALLSFAHVKAGEKVCDFPAGGGYLAGHMPAGVALTLLEKSAGFHGLIKAGAVLTQGNVIPFPDGYFDKILSMTGIHHEPDQAGFFRECARALKAGGSLCVGDVLKESPQARFLDIFVDRHSRAGHSGLFLDDGTAAAVAATGLRVEHAGAVSYPWVFASEDDMADFCAGLFGIEGLTTAEVRAGIGNYLSVRREDGKVLLDWQLYFIKAVK